MKSWTEKGSKCLHSESPLGRYFWRYDVKQKWFILSIHFQRGNPPFHYLYLTSYHGTVKMATEYSDAECKHWLPSKKLAVTRGRLKNSRQKIVLKNSRPRVCTLFPRIHRHAVIYETAYF